MKAEGDPAGKPTKEALIINAPTVRGHYSRRRPEPVEDTASRHSF